MLWGRLWQEVRGLKILNWRAAAKYIHRVFTTEKIVSMSKIRFATVCLAACNARSWNTLGCKNWPVSTQVLCRIVKKCWRVSNELYSTWTNCLNSAGQGVRLKRWRQLVQKFSMAIARLQKRISTASRLSAEHKRLMCRCYSFTSSRRIVGGVQ